MSINFNDSLPLNNCAAIIWRRIVDMRVVDLGDKHFIDVYF